MPFENSPEQYRPREAQRLGTAALLPNNREMQAFYQSSKTAVSEPNFLDFGTAANIYGKENVVAQIHRLDDQPLHGMFDKIHEPERGTKPFVDTGKILNPNDSSSWTLPKPENCKCWMPGDPINPATWHIDSSLYIQEIMRQNFVIDADGKRVSILDLDNKRYDTFKKQFGNAARHALGMGDLIFDKGMKPEDAQTGMFLHEPTGWVGGLIKSAVAHSWKPYREEMRDSDADLKNNAYAAKQSALFHDFTAFARQMLSDCWKSATTGSWAIEDGRK